MLVLHHIKSALPSEWKGQWELSAKIFDIIGESLGAIRNMAANCLVVPLLDDVFQLSHITEDDNDQRITT